MSAAPRAESGVAEFFKRDGYIVLRSMVSESVRTPLAQHLIKLSRVGILRSGDDQVPDCPAMYAEPVVEELLEALRPRVEEITGLNLFPTYSYVRLYEHGASLARHRDRPACEISLSLSLAAVPGTPWPIWIEGFRGTEAFDLKPGDGLLYRGIECTHWRERFEGELVAQAFLHYVECEGRHKEWKFDKREALNI